jgi:hypothetical protein
MFAAYSLTCSRASDFRVTQSEGLDDSEAQFIQFKKPLHNGNGGNVTQEIIIDGSNDCGGWLYNWATCTNGGS